MAQEKDDDDDNSNDDEDEDEKEGGASDGSAATGGKKVFSAMSCIITAMCEACILPACDRVTPLPVIRTHLPATLTHLCAIVLLTCVRSSYSPACDRLGRQC